MTCAQARARNDVYSRHDNVDVILCWNGGGWRGHASPHISKAVSYTHLTLPTKLEV